MRMYQCDSCLKTTKQPIDGLPNGWGRVNLQLPYAGGDITDIHYDLCNQCVRQPITFGNTFTFTWERNVNA